MEPLYTHVNGGVNNYIILWHYFDRRRKIIDQPVENIIKKINGAIKNVEKIQFIFDFSKRWVNVAQWMKVSPDQSLVSRDVRR
jgi:hypothetical protein